MKRIQWGIVLCFLAAARISGINTVYGENERQAEGEEAQREMLREQLGAPFHYQTDLSSESGITTIHVDAEVIIPEVFCMGQYEAIPRPFLESELQEVYELVKGSGTWTSAFYGEFDFDGTCRYQESGRSQRMMYEFGIDTMESWEQGGDYRYLVSSYGLWKDNSLALMPRLQYFRSLPYTSGSKEGIYDIDGEDWLPLTDGRAEGCTITEEEAIAAADEAVHRICPDYELTVSGQTLPTEQSDPMARFFCFNYTRHINGAAVNSNYLQETVTSGYDYTSGLGVIKVVVADDGICYFSYYNPYDLGQCIEEECRLLPFDQIMEIYETLGLLSREYLEMYDEIERNHLELYEIRLGYMSVRQADGSYAYKPVWDFYGRQSLAGTGGYAHASEVEDRWGWSRLTLDAVEGTVIDRDYGY